MDLQLVHSLKKHGMLEISEDINRIGINERIVMLSSGEQSELVTCYFLAGITKKESVPVLYYGIMAVAGNFNWKEMVYSKEQVLSQGENPWFILLKLLKDDEFIRKTLRRNNRKYIDLTGYIIGWDFKFKEEES